MANLTVLKNPEHRCKLIFLFPLIHLEGISSHGGMNREGERNKEQAFHNFSKYDF